MKASYVVGLLISVFMIAIGAVLTYLSGAPWTLFLISIVAGAIIGLVVSAISIGGKG